MEKGAVNPLPRSGSVRLPHRAVLELFESQQPTPTGYTQVPIDVEMQSTPSGRIDAALAVAPPEAKAKDAALEYAEGSVFGYLWCAVPFACVSFALGYYLIICDNWGWNHCNNDSREATFWVMISFAIVVAFFIVSAIGTAWTDRVPFCLPFMFIVVVAFSLLWIGMLPIEITTAVREPPYLLPNTTYELAPAAALYAGLGVSAGSFFVGMILLCFYTC